MYEPPISITIQGDAEELAKLYQGIMAARCAACTSAGAPSWDDKPDEIKPLIPEMERK